MIELLSGARYVDYDNTSYEGFDEDTLKNLKRDCWSFDLKRQPRQAGSCGRSLHRLCILLPLVISLHSFGSAIPTNSAREVAGLVVISSSPRLRSRGANASSAVLSRHGERLGALDGSALRRLHAQLAGGAPRPHKRRLLVVIWRSLRGVKPHGGGTDRTAGSTHGGLCSTSSPAGVSGG
jgi:hypothetical protein